MDIGAYETGVDRKAFAADQPLGHAALNGHLEQSRSRLLSRKRPCGFFEKVE